MNARCELKIYSRPLLGNENAHFLARSEQPRCVRRPHRADNLTGGNAKVLFHMHNNITSLTCAEVNYHLVTQKCK